MDYNQSVSSVSDGFLRLVEKRHHEINDPAFECTRFNYSAVSFFGLTFAPAESAKCGSQQLSGQLGYVVHSLSFVPRSASAS